MKTTEKTKNNAKTNAEPNANGPMIDLCVISYSPIQDIEQEVKNLNAGWNVVWGPAQLKSSAGVSYSLMYIVNDPVSQETAVVIRGTQFDSAIEWFQDLDIVPLVEFSQFVPGISSDIKITSGMSKALNDLLSLTDPNTGQTAVSYLKDNPSSAYYVTGHSLGGALTPALMATLNYQLFDSTTSSTIATYPFAAPAFGNSAYGNYIDSLGNGLPTRVCNPLDVVPFCFVNLSGFENIYVPYGISWTSVSKLFRDAIEALFFAGELEGLAQYGQAFELAGVFNTNPEYDNFLAQILYQHHVTTYQKLIQGS